jgi:hypothetical protein
VEFKNVIARTAHIKEAMQERRWKVTPRSVPDAPTPEPTPPATPPLSPSRQPAA